MEKKAKAEAKRAARRKQKDGDGEAAAPVRPGVDLNSPDYDPEAPDATN